MKETSMNNLTDIRIINSFKMALPRPPEIVFPLLCPVEEYNWIPIWACDIVYTESGVAEKDCVFITTFRESGEEIWTCTRYEPSECVEYVYISPGEYVARLTITLSPDSNGGARAEWSHTVTRLPDATDTVMERFSGKQYAEEMQMLEKMLVCYLETGEMVSVSEV